MKPENWISATGRRPWVAMPTPRPAISPSARGGPSTRSAPKRRCRPSVARNTPPLTPTSSPNTTTFGSAPRAWARARLMASTRVTSAMVARSRCGGALFGQFPALPGEGGGQGFVQVVEHGGGGRRRGGEVGGHLLLHLPGAVGQAFGLLGFIPGAEPRQIAAQAQHRLPLAVVLHFVPGAIAGGIIGGGVVGEAIGEGLDEVGPLPPPCPLDGKGQALPQHHHIVAVHLLAAEARRQGLLRQGL